MTRQAKIDRARVLDAAEALISEQGPSSLTLDALAARTGLSKGGLQYAFKSKEGLIRAMIQRLTDQSQTGVEQAQAAGKPASRVAVWLETLTAIRPSAVHTALLAAVVQNPKLLDGVAASYRAQLRAVAGDDLPLERVTALSLAADGLVLGELLGLVRLSAGERKRVVKEIVGLTALL